MKLNNQIIILIYKVEICPYIDYSFFPVLHTAKGNKTKSCSYAAYVHIQWEKTDGGQINK